MMVIFIFLSLGSIGDLYYNAGQFELAAIYYEASQRIEMKDHRLRLGKVYYLLNDYNKSVFFLRDLTCKEAKKWLGLSHFKNGNYWAAVQTLSEISGDPTGGYYLAVSHYKTGDYISALSGFEAVSDHYPPDEINFWRAMILAKLGRSEEALKFLDRIGTGWWQEHGQYLDSYIREEKKLRLNYLNGDRILLLRAKRSYNQGDIGRTLILLDSVKGYEDYQSLGRAMCYLKLNLNRQAINTLNHLADSGWTYDLRHLLLGRANLNLKKYKRAREHFHKSGRIGIGGLIRTFYYAGNLDSVLYYCDKVKPHDLELQFIRARALYGLGRYDEVLPVLKKITEENPETNYGQQSYIMLGETFQQKGMTDSARKVWQGFAERFPASPLAGLALKKTGDSYYLEKQYHSAVAAYERVKDYPHTASIVEEAGYKAELARYYGGKTRSYLQALKHYLKRFPESFRAPQISLKIGEIYQKYGLLNRAIRWYRQAIKDFPSIKGEALHKIAEIQKITGDLNGLKNTYHIIISSENDSWAMERLAKLYLSLEEYDSAIFWFENLSKFEDYHDIAYLELARVYRKIGKNKEAQVFLNLLIRKGSKKMDEAVLELAEILKESGRFDEARRVLVKIAEDPRSHLILGEIEFLSGRYLEAKVEFIKAGSLFFNDRDACAEALIQAGDAARRGKDYDEAKKIYERARLLSSDPRIKIRVRKRIESLP